VGDGPFKQELMRLVKKLSLDDAVSFEGLVPRSKLVNYYANCDVYVQPSLSEAFPSTIREAMSTGRPVITTDVGFIREHVIDGMNGFIVPKSDSEILANKIMMLVSDEDLRLKMGIKARKYAEDNFSWSKIVRIWQQTYIETLSLKRSNNKNLR
jgi:glycosyltransferase involved in cell wall biosynthesis